MPVVNIFCDDGVSLETFTDESYHKFTNFYYKENDKYIFILQFYN